MAVPGHLHGPLAIQMVGTLGIVDVQVLNGVVIVHIQGNVHIHAPQVVHQLNKAVDVHLHVPVNDDAEHVGHILDPLL